MLAIDELLNAGYTNVAWVGGGFNSVRDGDFLNVGGSTKLQWATIGGASEYLLKLTVLLTGLLNTVAGDASSKKHWWHHSVIGVLNELSLSLIFC